MGGPRVAPVARMRAAVARAVGDHGPVLVALSGGLDSVVLLHLLRFELRCDVRAAHFDHAMRPASGRDAAWVRGLCRAWRVPLESARAEDAPRSEAAARELRYMFLSAAADRAGTPVIAMAHHADDQAETVLFRLARGTGLRGLAGIPARRGRIVRPLLAFTRAQLEAYAAARRLRWREDETNRSLRYARNRIRHLVLPELERARPGATQRIARIARSAAAADRALRSIVDAAIADVVEHARGSEIVLARERLLAYDPHVRARVLRHLLERLGSRPDRAGTRAAMMFAAAGGSGGAVQLTGDVRLERDFDRLTLRWGSEEPQRPDTVLRIADAGPGAGTFVAGGREYVARWAPAGGPELPGRVARFDPSSLRFPLELRAWRPGDRIRLGYGRKKLKSIFREHRVARRDRPAVPVLTDGAGTVLWVVGVLRSVDARADEATSVFEIMVADDDSG